MPRKKAEAAPAAPPQTGDPRMDSWGPLLTAASNHSRWANRHTGAGVGGIDRTVGTTYGGGMGALDRDLVASLYQGDGLARRIVDLPATEMTREWIEIEGVTQDENVAILGALEVLDAQAKFCELIRWSRLYGGAIMVMGLGDGGDTGEPMNEAAIERVGFLQVFDRHEVTWEDGDLYADEASPKYGTPEVYTVRPVGGLKDFRVHESRVLVMDGMPLPPHLRRQNRGWGDSALNNVYTALKNVGMAQNGAANIILDFIVGVLTMPTLYQMLGAPDGEQLINTRLHYLDMSRSILHTKILAEGETYEKKASPVSGLPELMDRFDQKLAHEIGWPTTVLLSQSPGGLNSTGESDTRMFYDKMAGEQNDRLQKPLERLVRLLLISQNGPTRGVEPPSWKVAFKPLWQMGDKEVADVRKVNAEADATYIREGVLSAERVALSRFGGDRYGAEIQLSDEEVAAYEETLSALPDLAREQREAEPDDETGETEGAAQNGNGVAV